MNEQKFAKQHITKTNKLLTHLKANTEIRMRFVKLGKATLRTAGFSDGSFATNEEHIYQKRYIVFLADAEGKDNFIHNTSTKWMRIVRSTLGAEKMAMYKASYMSISLKKDIEEMTGKKIEHHMITDS